jgi:Transposase domain (DUF772)
MLSFSNENGERLMMERQDEPGCLFYRFNLERHVPSHHLLRQIDAVLDLSEIRRSPYYAATGRPSIDPELMIRMLLIGYAFAIRSERRSATRCISISPTGGIVCHEHARATVKENQTGSRRVAYEHAVSASTATRDAATTDLRYPGAPCAARARATAQGVPLSASSAAIARVALSQCRGASGGTIVPIAGQPSPVSL